MGCVDAAHEKSVTRNVDANKCRGKSQLLPVAMVAERPFAARKNGPFSRFITDEKSISHETQRGSFALALITLCETSLGLTPRTKFVFSRWFLVEIASSELFWCAAPAHLPRSRPASAESRRAWHGPGRLPSPPVARAPAEPQSWGDCGTLIRAGGAAQHAGKRCPGSAHARKARPHRPCMASNRSVKPQNF